MQFRSAAAVIVTAATLFLPDLTAAKPPPRPDGPVADYANILDQSARADLDRLCRELEKSGKGVLAVATVPSLEGESIEQYGIELVTAWEIGHKGKDDGVLLLIAPNERKVRIEVGYGLEGKLPDGRCGAIIRDYITPAFKRSDMNGGTLAGARAIAAIMGGRAPARSADEVPDNTVQTIASLTRLFFIFLLIAGMMLYRYWSRRNDPRWRNRQGPGGSSFWLGGFSGSGGFGSGGGGGFGGFGGGGFGGGGASGGW
jgi:uncharacterized protein